MRTDGDFLKLELTDGKTLYIARSEITRIIFDKKANGYTIFTKADSSGEIFLETEQPLAYKAIKLYVSLKS